MKRRAEDDAIEGDGRMAASVRLACRLVENPSRLDDLCFQSIVYGPSHFPFESSTLKNACEWLINMIDDVVLPARVRVRVQRGMFFLTSNLCLPIDALNEAERELFDDMMDERHLAFEMVKRAPSGDELLRHRHDSTVARRVDSVDVAKAFVLTFLHRVVPFEDRFGGGYATLRAAADMATSANRSARTLEHMVRSMTYGWSEQVEGLLSEGTLRHAPTVYSHEWSTFQNIRALHPTYARQRQLAVILFVTRECKGLSNASRDARLAVEARAMRAISTSMMAFMRGEPVRFDDQTALALSGLALWGTGLSQFGPERAVAVNPSWRASLPMLPFFMPHHVSAALGGTCVAPSAAKASAVLRGAVEDFVGCARVAHENPQVHDVHVETWLSAARARSDDAFATVCASEHVRANCHCVNALATMRARRARRVPGRTDGILDVLVGMLVRAPPKRVGGVRQRLRPSGVAPNELAGLVALSGRCASARDVRETCRATECAVYEDEARETSVLDAVHTMRRLKRGGVLTPTAVWSVCRDEAKVYVVMDAMTARRVAFHFATKREEADISAELFAKRLADLRWEDVVKTLAPLWKTNVGHFEPNRETSMAALAEMQRACANSAGDGAEREAVMKRVLGAAEGARVSPRNSEFARKAPTGAAAVARWWAAREKTETAHEPTIDLMRSPYSSCLEVDTTDCPLWTPTPDLLDTLAVTGALAV